MQSKEYGLIAVDELAKHLTLDTMTLDIEQPKELSVHVSTRQPSDEGFWHKVVGEIPLGPDMRIELARHSYQQISRLVGERAALDVYELLVRGDTESEDAYLALLDGAKKSKAKIAHVKFSKDGTLLEIKGKGAAGVIITLTTYISVLFE